ncbi:hypothetical protein Tco_1199785 [Tanacetum coccineum]
MGTQRSKSPKVRMVYTGFFLQPHRKNSLLMKKKGKQHKASCKAKIDRYVTHPLHTLHIDLFGPTSAQAQSQPSPTPPPIPTSTSPPPHIPSPTPPPIPSPTSPPPPPPPPETEPTTDEYLYEEHSPVHHHFSPSQE